MRRTGMILSLLLLPVFATISSGQGLNTDRMGFGFNVGGQKLFGDADKTGFGLGIEGILKYKASDRLAITGGLGYGQFKTDSDDYGSMTSNPVSVTVPMLTVDLRGAYYLVNKGNARPYATLGLGIHGFSLADVNSQYNGLFYGGSFFYGGGVELFANDRGAINLSADYRFTTGDDLDAHIGGGTDGYLNIRAGFTYHMSSQLDGAVSPGRIADADADQLFQQLQDEEQGGAEGLFDMGGGQEQSGEFGSFADKLSDLEGAETTEFTMEQYIRIKSKLDELNELITQKEEEISSLRSSLDSKDQQITDLEGKIAQLEDGGSHTSHFASNREMSGASSVGASEYQTSYEEGLRNFYGRNYRDAIEIFSYLIESNNSHKLASNCAYWIGESYHGLREYSTAVEYFSQVLDYPRSFKKDDALLMMGLCYMKLGDNGSAEQSFAQLIDHYPDSEYVDKAARYLQRMGVRLEDVAIRDLD